MNAGQLVPPLWINICEHINTVTGVHNVHVPLLNFTYTYTKKYPQPLTEYSFSLGTWDFPGKFSNLNIYSLDNPPNCQSSGDIYAWNASDWNIETKFPALISIKKEKIVDICKAVTSLEAKVPRTFADTLNLLELFGKGKIADIYLGKIGVQFDALQSFDAYNGNVYFGPYQEINGNKSFFHIYTNVLLLENTNWCPGSPGDTDAIVRYICYDECLFACFDTVKASSFLQLSGNAVITLR